jgi:hypothetical protein
LELGALDNGMYEIKYLLILKPGKGDDDSYERIGLLELHMNICGLDERSAAPEFP